jgi:ABC-type multidrug transport system fused ATPase/permease subunit
MMVPYNVASRQAHALLFGFLEERLAGLEDIRANGAGAYVALRFAQLQRDVYHKALKAEMSHALTDMLSTGFFALAYVGALGLGAWLFQANAITVGTIFLVVRYTQMLREPMQQLTRQLQELQRASAGIVRIRELLNLRRQVQDGRGECLPPGALSVEFCDVSFEYEDGAGNGADARVLHDLSFSLPPGQTLGLLGRTGSGKTTLTRLLLRLYDPTAGEIRLGGVDIRAARLHELRRAMGMVTQDVQLFGATLRDNLTLFEAGISDEKILRALGELGLTSWYTSLPDGLDTQLAPGGGGLSAGEAQLLAFTRVLLRDPALVILDEASARLDPATERLIERAVDKLLRNRTGIIIAHRLATVQRADAIMILDDGHICEHGPRVQLAADPYSRFYQLLRTGLEEVLV